MKQAQSQARSQGTKMKILFNFFVGFYEINPKVFQFIQKFKNSTLKKISDFAPDMKKMYEDV